MSAILYYDRREAGRVVANAVAAAGLPDLEQCTVLGLARGGVPVAYEVARSCGLALDVMVVRKLGAPRNPEFAMGAIASGGAVVIDPYAVAGSHVSQAQLDALIATKREELDLLEADYRQGRPPLEFGEGGVILVDDGLATGASMRAAIKAVRPRAKQVTVAVPVAARSTVNELSTEVDRIVCTHTPRRLDAVSLFYHDFSPTSDEEVRALLAEASKWRVGKPGYGNIQPVH